MKNNENISILKMIEYISKVERYTNNCSFDSFSDNEEKVDATIFAISQIGELVKNISKETMDKYDLTFYSMGIWEAQNTYVYNTVKYAPSIIIIKDKKVIAYLDAESDEDLIKYQDSDEFEKWLDKYIHLKK